MTFARRNGGVGLRWGSRVLALVAGVAALAALGPAAAPTPEAAEAAVPSGFQESTVISGLQNPTVVRFAPDGRIFVAEKSGLIKVYDSLLDPTPTTFADLRTNVYNFWDRGLLGMALDPAFPSKPYVYVLYTYDHILGDPASPPKWGAPGVTSDGCPTPPGATTDGCVVSARLSRLQAVGDVMTGPEQVLVEGWCQQFPSHSIGTVDFGPDGALYASGGDGASFNYVDSGQTGNPCGDPANEGGALRSQDLRTTGDPTGLDGSIIRVSPTTGAALPDNPQAGSSDANTRRIIAYGLRNPFRFAFRPGTEEMWIGDVGWNDWEEINRILDPTDSTVENFGWPCYEGTNSQAGYDAANIPICETLYGQPNTDLKPYFKYNHANKVGTENCAIGSSSLAGMSFEFAPQGSSFPAAYRGALFFADYSRDCIWAMQKNGNGPPSPGSIRTFVDGAANPVNLEFGPGGDLFYVDFDGGTIRRVSSTESAPAGTTFGAPTSYPTGTNAHGVATGDLNGDGKLDLAVANAGNNNVSVLLGNGDGTFGAPTNSTTGTTPKAVTIADLNDDNKLDLATADQGSNTVSVLFGNGSGSFAPPVSYPVCSGTHEVAVGNFNGDGLPDLAAACWGGSVISVLLGTGAGSFASAIDSAAGGAPHSLVVRDFNRDSKQDLAVANHDSNNVSVLFGQGTGSFAAPVNYAVGTSPHSIRLGDFNGDGNADLATANDGSNNVSILLGSSNGTFGAATSYPTGLVPKGIAVGDFNGDGKRDLVTANTAGRYPAGGTNPGGDQISLLLGNGNGTFGGPTNYTAGNTPFSVAVGQFNDDGQTDVATANWFGNNVSVLINTTGSLPSGTTYLSDLTWTSMTNGWGPVERDTSNGESAAGDGSTITINGATFAKGLGAHALSDVRYAIPANCNRFKATVGVDDEAGDLYGDVSFQVYADANQIYDSGVMTGTSAAKSIDVSIAGAAQLRLAVGNGGDDVSLDHADWADARMECSSGADTTPPVVNVTSPTNGATGVSVAVSPTATFSEAMDPATLTTSTFTLVKQGQATPVAATVSYAGAVATLDPSADLEANTSYTATVKGGSSGAKDVAGNALASDVSWSFTTASSNQAPSAFIDTPASTLHWKVGDTISFTGHATDPQQGTLAASALSWTLVLQHCPSNCHTHTLQSWPGVASGSFSAPDHEYPSYLELQLTATDSSGLVSTTSVRLDPTTVDLTFLSSPTGLQLAVNATSSTTTFTRTVIVGSSNSLSATSPQTLNGTTYTFSSWSDGGVATHNIVAPATATSYTATYTSPSSPPVNTVLPSISGPARVGRTLTAGDGTWTGTTPMTFAYQWLRCTTSGLNTCTTISGATAKSYVATSADVNFRLRVRVTATNAAGSGTATSNATGSVKA